MKKIIVLFLILSILPIVYAHETCNQTNSSIETLPEGYCNVELKLETDKDEYKNGEKIIIYNQLTNKSYNFTIDYWIEDDKGIVIKEKVSTANTNNKQYTIKLNESTNITIKNNLSYIDCININNKTKNELNLKVFVEKDPQPQLTIEKIYINRTKTINIGDNLTATIKVYSGNNTNYTIKIYIENLTETKEYKILENFSYNITNTTTEIPYDCNIKTGNYNFVVESNDISLMQNFTIINICESNLTIREINESSNSTYESNSSESIINVVGNTLTGRTIYESANVKAKDIAVYLFMVVLAAITILIIISNKNTDKSLKKSTEKWSSQLEQ
ncbi:hypothetical protein HYU23_00185 [Candidatus Woesearchaeota archaeon]|nr:hypothetical protein [Candidatus Woesearchaeota archaeon]